MDNPSFRDVNAAIVRSDQLYGAVVVPFDVATYEDLKALRDMCVRRMAELDMQAS